MEVPNGRMRRTQMVAPNGWGGKLCRARREEARKANKGARCIPGAFCFGCAENGLLCAGQPAVEDGKLSGRQVVVEANTHAKSGTDVDNGGRELELLAEVGQADRRSRGLANRDELRVYKPLLGGVAARLPVEA